MSSTAIDPEVQRLIAEATALLAERKDMEMAFWSFDNLPIIVKRLAALTEERDEAVKREAALKDALPELQMVTDPLERLEAWAGEIEGDCTDFEGAVLNALGVLEAVRDFLAPTDATLTARPTL